VRSSIIYAVMTADPHHLIRLTHPPPSEPEESMAREFGDDPESLKEIKRYLALGDAAMKKRPDGSIERRLYEMRGPLERDRAA
jgi:hypothetical protein